VNTLLHLGHVRSLSEPRKRDLPFLLTPAEGLGEATFFIARGKSSLRQT
jgi:hypothetical protein